MAEKRRYVLLFVTEAGDVCFEGVTQVAKWGDPAPTIVRTGETFEPSSQRNKFVVLDIEDVQSL